MIKKRERLNTFGLEEHPAKQRASYGNHTSMEHYTSDGKKITRGEIKKRFPKELLEYGSVPKTLKFEDNLFDFFENDDDYIFIFQQKIERYYIDNIDIDEENIEIDDDYNPTFNWDEIITVDDLIDKLKHL